MDYAVAVCGLCSLFFRRFDVAEEKIKHAVVGELQKAADKDRHVKSESLHQIGGQGRS